MAKKFPPIHPGEILLEEFLRPMGISQYRLAKSINVPPRRINEAVHGKRNITADTAPAAFPVLRHQREVLAESPDPIRSGSQKGPAWRPLEIEVSQYAQAS